MAVAFHGLLGNQFVFVANRIRNPEIFSGIKVENIDCNWRRFRTIYGIWWLIRHAKILIAGDRQAVLYTKDSYLCAIAILLRPFLGYRVAFESHLIYHSWRDLLIAKQCDAIFTVTAFLKSSLVKDFGAAESKVTVAPDAVDLSVFDISMDRETARERLDLPKDKKIFVYTGRFKTLGMDKGIAVALEALKSMNDQQLVVLAIGGSKSDVDEYKAIANRLGVGGQSIFIGYVSQSKLALYQKAADALLMPFPYSEHFAYYMSPLKMFEYMASRVPIIASDLPAVRDVLDESTALIVKPGDPKSLAEAMNEVAYGGQRVEELAMAAYEKVKEYTWQKRARKIIDFISHRT